jgi:phosphatidylglycerophosphate synthase
MLNVPNALSALRLIVVVMLWPAALAGRHVLIAGGIAFACATDVADGIIARGTGTRTRFGSQLDSIADFALMGSTLAWLALLRPEFFRENRTLLLVWIALAIVTLVVGAVRFRRLGDLHLYSAKVAGSLSYLFAIWLLLTGDYPRWAFYIAYTASTLAALEALLIFATGKRDKGTRGHGGSILPFPRRRAQSPRP